jgi:two-component SAPR family response regulator
LTAQEQQLQTSALRLRAVSDWEPCADTFYCQEHLYDLGWQDVDLDVQRWEEEQQLEQLL